MIVWIRVLAVGREVGRSGYFQGIFKTLRQESTEFADELDIAHKTREMSKIEKLCEDRDFSLLFNVVSLPTIQCQLLNRYSLN